MKNPNFAACIMSDPRAGEPQVLPAQPKNVPAPVV